MVIHVRHFEESDREPLRLLYVASRDATFTWEPSGSHQAADFDKHTEGEIILVAVVEAEIRGFASIWEPDSFLHNLFVHPLHKRQGIGQALLKGCNPYFANTPTLKCLQANINAAQFYYSQGWITLRDETGPEGPYHLMAKRAPHGWVTP
ncbi:MAG: GNAT family N-acetyltransferase [Aquabacterium sp.]|jgi:GNAT superfamily N-acetyltransferase|uniref:GNAT family N-acetyltransferase n=1 Tax=Aquabacterium sp. TaxID=1872578 RepID=UPI002A36EAE5|nr:GNAT family N-acetyltransferase [Aquabacterium sp.]MDX9845218.1 GNAT family N-acetyltransferase [Aquabacterium sp.]